VIKIKKILKYLIIIIFILAIAGTGVYFFIQETIIESCEFQRGSTTSGIYTCNSQNGCYAWIEDISCNKVQTVPKVIARTNKNFGSPITFKDSDAWISVDFDESGVLESNEGFTRTTSRISCILGQAKTKILNYPSTYIYNNNLFVCYSSDNAYKYIKSEIADTNNNFLDSDVAGVNVIKAESTGTAYYCKSSYIINGETMYLEYAEDKAGSYGLDESDAVSLNYQESIELKFDGTINYKEKVCAECECSKNICVGTAYRKCEDINYNTGCGTLSEKIYSCENKDICIQGECRLPYVLYTETEDSEGRTKTTFKPEEDIVTRLYIDSDIDKSITVYLDLYSEGSITDTFEETINLPMEQGDYIYTDIGKLSIGNYEIKARISDYGMEYTSDKLFSVSGNLIIYSRFLEKTSFTTNKDIKIRIDVFDSSGELRENIPDYETNIKVDATLDNEQVSYDHRQVATGEYEYTFNFDDVGMFKAEFEINHPSYQSIKTSKSHYIEEPSLLITTLFKDIESTGEYDLDFDVTDIKGDKIPPDKITITLTTSRGRKTEVLSGREISGSAGEYSFNYNFGEEDIYKLEIYVEKQGYTPDTSTTLIDIIKTGEVIGCGDGICNRNENEITCPQDCKEPFNWLIVVFIGIIVIIVGGFVILLVRKRK